MFLVFNLDFGTEGCGSLGGGRLVLRNRFASERGGREDALGYPTPNGQIKHAHTERCYRMWPYPYCKGGGSTSQTFLSKEGGITYFELHRKEGNNERSPLHPEYQISCGKRGSLDSDEKAKSTYRVVANGQNLAFHTDMGESLFSNKCSPTYLLTVALRPYGFVLFSNQRGGGENHTVKFASQFQDTIQIAAKVTSK